MRFPLVFAAMFAEMRATRRLIRYWIFVMLAVLLGAGNYVQFSVMHGFGSNMSATIASMGPRYFIANIGINLILMILVGQTFLAFDIRSRDERDNMAEVLDVRPYTNLEFLLGRGLGLTLMMWLPIVIVLLMLELIGLIAVAFQWRVGGPIEPWSVVGFLIYSFCLMSMWTLFLTMLSILVRYRLLVVILGLGFIGAQGYIVFQLPLYLQSFIGLLPNFDMASDINPLLFAEGDLLKQLAWLMVAAACLLIAAARHPRRDGSARGSGIALGAALFSGGVAVVVGQAFWSHERVQFSEELLAIHQARADAPRIDIEQITGLVDIDPGSLLTLDLEIAASVPVAMEMVLLTLNPGLEVSDIEIDGSAAAFTQANGLVEIQAPLNRGQDILLSIRASGAPLEEFGYLDQALNLFQGSFSNAQLGLLGFSVSIFNGNYVALMPGGYWLPRAGSAVPTADTRRVGPDYYLLDINVSAPSDWLVAGPGRREQVNGGYRFAPAVPLTDVGLIASRFTRYAVTAADVDFEILLTPQHAGAVDTFSDAADAIESRLSEFVSNAEGLGLAYPFGTLSIVEAPSRLRTYGGGWHMDTTLALPGLMVMRENGFPYARFDNQFRFDSQQARDEFLEEFDGGIGQAKVEALERFSENDFSGGNVFLGVARNFLYFQTSAVGEGAPALNYILNHLATKLLTDREGYFSAHEYNQQINGIIGRVMADMGSGKTDSVAQAVRRATANRPEVWDRAIGVSLAELDPTDNPRQALNVLSLKGNAIAQLMLDGLGREAVGQLLAEVVARYRGRSFTAVEFFAVASDLGLNLEDRMGDWLFDSGLPGFLVSEVTVERLPDEVTGQPRYQTRFHVRNDEAVPGLFIVTYNWGNFGANAATNSAKGDKVEDRTLPYRIEGNAALEIGIVTPSPITGARLVPYFSLNRDPIVLTTMDKKTAIALKQGLSGQQFPESTASPLQGARSSEWNSRVGPGAGTIVVDDLDPGFSVDYDGARDEVPKFVGSWFFGGFNLGLDQGLPEHSGFMGLPQWWSRNSEEVKAYGKYRRTFAINRAGDGGARARFETDIPDRGRWRLEYHIPNRETKLIQWGTYNITLLNGGDEHTVEFDASAAQSGWNSLGDFSLTAGETSIVISDATSGNLVIADAIRWQPLVNGN